MSGVFLDTVGILALWDQSDQWHADAEAAYGELVAARTPLVTTNLILFECGNAAARRPYRKQVDQLRRLLQQRNELIVPSADDIEQAWNANHRGDIGSAGIIDHVSFVIMRRMGITRAFTNDRHFQDAGFETLF